MRESTTFEIEEALPGSAEILDSQGMPDRGELPGRIVAILDSALSLFAELAEPRSLVAEISREEFAAVYRGEGLNSDATPLQTIFEQADGLALFAGTLGARVSHEITRCFAENDPALGYMLDAVASVSADRLADLLTARFSRHLSTVREAPHAIRTLPYSPGYCGWHISAQRRLFEFLRPDTIGITLTDTCLMEPLKSVSGVLVAGPASIHRFRPRYSFCADCRTHECLDRMESVRSSG